MAAPTNAANVKKVLANPEPSTHGRFGPEADSCTAANNCLFDDLVGAGLATLQALFRACAGVGLSSMSPVAICTTWTALRNYAFPQVELSNV